MATCAASAVSSSARCCMRLVGDLAAAQHDAAAPSAGSWTVASSITCWNEPDSSSAKVEREAWARSIDLGVTTTSGRFGVVLAWERSRWKYCADVDGTVTRRLPRARQREEALEARRRVLGALALVAVGQQQDEARELAPLVLGRHHEVVDDDLRAVGEVAELGLPGDQRLGRLDRVAVLEPDGGVLGEQRVADGEVAHLPRGLQRVGADAVQAVADVGQGDVLLAVGVVDQHGVAVAEGAAPGVLAGEAHVDALVHERADGQGLGQGPVDLPLGDQLVALDELALELGVDHEAVGHRAHHRGQGPQDVGRDAGLGGRRVARARVGAAAARSAPARARPAPRRGRPAGWR